jgi:hypothetical protein
MTARESKGPARKPVNLEAQLEEIARKATGLRTLKKGTVLVRATGAGGGDYLLENSERGVRLTRGATPGTPPVIEIIGDARRIQDVLAGQKDAAAHFLAGGFRIRGDLRYFSDLALELGILKEPL